MAKPKFGVPVIVVLVGLLLAGLIVARVSTTQGQSGQARKIATESQEEATPVQKGVLTAKQKAHRKLFKHPGPKLLDMAVKRAGDIEVQVDSGDVIILPESTAKPPILLSAVCHADAVVIGTLNSKSAQLTEDENFIFTDYEMAVEEVIKNNPSAFIQLNNSLTIVRSGGAVQINGRVFRAKREDFKPPVLGKRYLFFLKFIPETGAYLAYGNGTFQLDENKITSLGDTATHELLNGGVVDTTTFLNRVRAFVDTDCGQKQNDSK